MKDYLFLIVVIFSIAVWGQDVSEMLQYSHVKDSLLVRFKNIEDSKLDQARKDWFWQQLQVTHIKQLEIVPDLYAIQLPENSNLAAILPWLFNNYKDILYAEPNYIANFDLNSNDPYFEDGSLWGLEKIQAPQAWDSKRESDIIVAILDSGADPTHEDLKDNIWKNPYEFNGTPGIDDDENGYMDDLQGWNTVKNSANIEDDVRHGSHVAGIIGGTGNNKIGISGVCWKVQLMIVKVGDTTGITYAGAINGLEYARRSHAKICNMSFGAGSFSQAMYDAIGVLKSEGIICVCAAGNRSGNNNDINPYFPASYDHDNIVSVTASNINDDLHTTSAYGPNSVDIFAPGVGILSTVPPSLNAGKAYLKLNGTSMAAPHIAGCLALLWARYSDLTYQELIAKILRTVDLLPNGTSKVKSGGRVNIYNALMETEGRESGSGGCSSYPHQYSIISAISNLIPYLLLLGFFLKRKKR